MIFGKVELNSPYLWKKGRWSKPLIDEMGITHNGRSQAVCRALSDFGSEESFGTAAMRFKEHYKYELSSSTVDRVTKTVSKEAQAYVENKLFKAGESYGKESGVKIEEMLIELDGSELRTAKLKPKENSKDKSAVRQNPKKEKIIRWHEVRIGLARPINSATKIYIGKMDLYPAVVNHLFNASVLSGMSPETKVIGIADGGNGLKEELENQFENLKFILDKTHLKDHLYETAEELGIDCKERPPWVDAKLSKISKGHVDEVIEELEAIYSKSNIHRVKRLIGYLRRFINSVNYEEFKENGFPIGSGEVESAHKSIPQKRMKIPGACWHTESINPMLSLRVLRANGWWDDYWQNRTRQKLAA